MLNVVLGVFCCCHNFVNIVRNMLCRNVFFYIVNISKCRYGKVSSYVVWNDFVLGDVLMLHFLKVLQCSAQYSIILSNFRCKFETSWNFTEEIEEYIYIYLYFLHLIYSWSVDSKTKIQDLTKLTI